MTIVTTQSFNMRMMTPMQTNKEIMFNEALIIIDALLNPSIDAIVTTVPTFAKNKRYIMCANAICNLYFSLEYDISWRIIALRPGMTFYLQPEEQFVLYDGSKLQNIQTY